MNQPRFLGAAAAQAGPAATLLAASAAGSRYALVVLTLPPYYAGAALHCHPEQSEGCYVLEGTLALTRADQTMMLAPGAAATIAPGVPHTYWNPAAVPATLLVIYMPGGSAEQVAALALTPRAE
jgi:mannose-6-phosphate isomerase-like protein (cupin superfamily)